MSGQNGDGLIDWPCVRGWTRRVLGSEPLQFSLERASGNIQKAGRFREVAAAIFQDAVDVFPFRLGERWWVVGRLMMPLLGRRLAFEGSEDLIRIGRLAQIVNRTQSHRLDRVGDTPISGQDDRLSEGGNAEQFAEDLDPGGLRHFQIEHCPFGLRFFCLGNGVLFTARGIDIIPSSDKSPGEAIPEGIVVIN